MKDSIKVVVKMLAVAVAAVCIYLYGINKIDTYSWVKPDYVGSMTEQPSFTNTVRNW